MDRETAEAVGAAFAFSAGVLTAIIVDLHEHDPDHAGERVEAMLQTLGGTVDLLPEGPAKNLADICLSRLFSAALETPRPKR